MTYILESTAKGNKDTEGVYKPMYWWVYMPM